MKLTAIVVLILMVGPSRPLIGQEDALPLLSDLEIAILAEIPAHWTEVNFSRDGLPVIYDYCYASVPTIALEYHTFGAVTIRFLTNRNSRISRSIQ